MTNKNDGGYPSKLSKDLSILMNFGENSSVEREPTNPSDLVMVTASSKIPDAELHEVELYSTIVCTPDIPSDAVGEVVVDLMEQIRSTGVDILQQEIRLSFGRAADLG